MIIFFPDAEKIPEREIRKIQKPPRPASSSIKIDAEKEFRGETSLSNIERVIHYIKFFSRRLLINIFSVYVSVYSKHVKFSYHKKRVTIFKACKSTSQIHLNF